LLQIWYETITTSTTTKDLIVNNFPDLSQLHRLSDSSQKLDDVTNYNSLFYSNLDTVEVAPL